MMITFYGRLLHFKFCLMSTFRICLQAVLLFSCQSFTTYRHQNLVVIVKFCHCEQNRECKCRYSATSMYLCICIFASWTAMCYWSVLDVVRTPKASVWTVSAFSSTVKVAFQSTRSSRLLCQSMPDRLFF